MNKTTKILKNGIEIEQLEDRFEMASSAGSSNEVQSGLEVHFD